ncbi:substrate-binding domain-containing protein [Aeromicrobium sp. UC242_57]|uniref:substrate-binding domain-containing protein n=1 Tax=Aeromicrobium sp. UC242_57 TaxID=3374624 RepID=UPI0037AAFEA6
MDSAVADKYDGIVVSMANPDGLEDSIKKAVAAGIPVVTINSGVDRFKEFGAITHIGQTETIAGEAVGERLKAEGAKNAICVIQEAGNIGLEERCAAVKKTFGGQISNLQVDGTDDAAVQATITSKLQTDKDIDTVLTLGGQYAIDAVGSVEEAGSAAKVATFDLSEDVIKNIQDGKILFAVDQQPYVQGFLGITTLYLKDINGNDVGGGQPVNSGPAFITKDNADAVLKFAANGTR